MLFYSHRAPLPLHLAAVSEISWGATPLPIPSPFGPSEADATPSTGDRQVWETHDPGWVLQSQALDLGSHVREERLSFLVDLHPLGPTT